MQTTHKQNRSVVAHKNSTPKSQLLEITREYDVPVSQLFDAFKTPVALKQWWWPKDLHSDHIDLEFREDGDYFINMKGFDQGGGGMTGTFKEIVENERIVMTDHFADKNGRAISAKQAKMTGDWPAVVYITLEFESTGDDTSRLHLSQQGIPNDLQKDCIQGWNESFDKLENFLNGRKQ